MNRFLIGLATMLALVATFGAGRAFGDEADAWTPPIAPTGEQAAEFSPGYFVCWESHGYPLPNVGPICPDGWAGRAPENPYPVGPGPALPPPLVSRGEGHCGGTYKDESEPFSITAVDGAIIHEVFIKSGRDAFGPGQFCSGAITQDGVVVECYVVSGIGTPTVTVTKIEEEGCKDISHIEANNQEVTPTPSSTATPTPTSTAPVETPMPTSSPTPAVSPTPIATSTSAAPSPQPTPPLTPTTSVTPTSCYEDEPCWDCVTMGNRTCGPSQLPPTGGKQDDDGLPFVLWLALVAFGGLVGLGIVAAVNIRKGK